VITIVAQRGRNKAVITGVMNWRVKIAVELEDVQFFVILKFVGGVLRNFNDGTKDFGGAVTDGQLQVVDHLYLSVMALGFRESAHLGIPKESTY
jgi:hypothetical protein